MGVLDGIASESLGTTVRSYVREKHQLIDTEIQKVVTGWRSGFDLIRIFIKPSDPPRILINARTPWPTYTWAWLELDNDRLLIVDSGLMPIQTIKDAEARDIIEIVETELGRYLREL